MWGSVFHIRGIHIKQTCLQDRWEVYSVYISQPIQYSSYFVYVKKKQNMQLNQSLIGTTWLPKHKHGIHGTQDASNKY